MYKIIGVDGKEYGPVSADQIRAWIREGRCNVGTQVQAEGATGWTSLGQTPEFSILFSAPSPEPSPAMGVGTGASVDALLARQTDLDIFDCLGQGWHLMMRNFWLSLGVTVVASLIGGVPFIGMVIYPGWMMYYLKIVRGGKPTFEDLFAVFSDRFLHVFLAMLIGGLLSGVGFVCCIIPGIYLCVAWYFSGMVALDKKLDFWPAMELSRKIVTKHWFSVFFLAILVGLLQVVGALACLVGVFVTLGWGIASFACVYHALFDERPAAPTLAAPPSPAPAPIV